MNRRLCLLCLTAFGLISPHGAFGQQQIEAQKYAVASGHPAATAVGLEVLRNGGNVIDAAIATSLAVGVTEPYGSGLGGKIVLLYCEAATGKIHSIVGLCNSPAELDVEAFTDLPSKKREIGYLSVGVPGLVAGLDEAYKHWGSKPWGELVEPAAALAESGIIIDETMQGLYKAHVKDLRTDTEAADLYLYRNGLPPVGARLKNADLSATLRGIAHHCARSFYEGEIARQIVKAARNSGSSLSEKDFNNYRAEIGEALSIDYRGNRVYSCPPPLTGGVTVLATLKCFEQMPRLDSTSSPVAFANQMSRVLICLYPQIQAEVGDGQQSLADSQQLISAAAAAQLAFAAGKVDPLNPYPKLEKVGASADGLPTASTTHLVVADAAGNMVSLTQSLSLHFGAAVVAPGTGFLLNDSLSNFSVHDSQNINYVAPTRRARSTIAPIIVTRDDKPLLTLGIPGGQRIPTTTIQLLWQLLDQEKNLHDTFAASRFHLMRPVTSKQPFNRIELEADAPSAWDDELKSLHWKVKRYPRDGTYFGGGNAIQYSQTGRLIGVADPRRTNFVAGD
jgi:gamma-glutamyltranspeptidase / glutathione hydrolase